MARIIVNSRAGGTLLLCATFLVPTVRFPRNQMEGTWQLGRQDLECSVDLIPYRSLSFLRDVERYVIRRTGQPKIATNPGDVVVRNETVS
jgi:hypothetical protein